MRKGRVLRLSEIPFTHRAFPLCTSGLRNAATSLGCLRLTGQKENQLIHFQGNLNCSLLDIHIICSFLSRLRRAKSLSTPSLAAAPTQTRGQCPGLSPGHAAAACWPRFSLHPLADSGEERKRREPSVSKVEQQRQQILEEMKKRTQLLTDNSWIRQRSSSVYKEPIYVPLKRLAWLFWL